MTLSSKPAVIQHTHPEMAVHPWFAARRTWLLVGILVIAAAFYSWKFDAFQVGIYKDDADYVVLAKSIVVGPSYGLVNQPEGALPTRYPFGWPLLLAPAYAISGGDFQALKIVSFLATLTNIAIIGLAWKWLGLARSWIGLATAALYAFLPRTVGLAGVVMSEAAFLTFVLVCLALSTYLGSSTQKRYFQPLLLGTAWMFAAYSRTIGITVVIACLIYLLWHRRWHTAALSTAALGVSLLLVVVVTPVALSDLIDFGEYQAQFTNPGAWGVGGVESRILIRAIEGGDSYLRQYVRDAIIPFVGDPSARSAMARFGLGWAPEAVSIIVVFLVAVGYVLSLVRGGLHPSHLYILPYLAILSVWPWRGDRFLYGVLPYLIAYILIAGAALGDRLALKLQGVSRGWVFRIGRVMLALWLSALLARSALIDRSTDHTPDLRVGATWIRENAPLDAVVAAEQPRVAYLYVQRPTVGLRAFDDLSSLSCLRPTFALIAPQIEWRHDGQLEISDAGLALARVLQEQRTRAAIVFQDPNAKVTVFRLYCTAAAPLTTPCPGSCLQSRNPQNDCDCVPPGRGGTTQRADQFHGRV